MKKKLGGIVSAILTCVMIITAGTSSLATAASAKGTTASTVSENSYRVTKKKITLYFDGDDKKKSVYVYFMNDSDVPYLDVRDFFEHYFKDVDSSTNYRVSATYAADGDIFTVTRDKYYDCVFDFAKDTIYFEDFDEFFRHNTDESLVDWKSIFVTDDNGKPLYINRIKSAHVDRYGSDITMDLGAYGIDMVHKGKGYYVPIQTISDIFMSKYSCCMLYNGRTLIFTEGSTESLYDENNNLTSTGKLYYKAPKIKQFSKAFTDYNYAELCFLLDYFYGLKKQHNITSFEELLRSTGLKEELLSRDPSRMDAAIVELFSAYIDDQHSGYSAPSYSAETALSKKIWNERGLGLCWKEDNENLLSLLETREKFYPDGVPGYEEIGDTAFITFDYFNIDNYYNDIDYYKTAPTADSTETMGIISYSVQRILRAGSPVKNVVLDLTCNSGGSTDAGIYAAAAFLGTATVAAGDTMTGAYSINRYQADTNFDKKYDSRDTLAGKGLNLYCMISECSFSCGNAVPAIFKQSPEVHLIGRTTGGGSCVPFDYCTATGTLFSSSTPKSMFTLKNGSLFDTEGGIEPDYYIGKSESNYDRKKLIEYIHTLM